MTSFAADPETMLIRTTVVSVALQTLVGRLLAGGLLDGGDLVAMRETGLQLASDLAELGGQELAGERMAAEVEAWWRATEVLGGL